MIIELTFIGILVGAIAGFFGVGGGMVLVPMLIFIGFNIKSAIAISVVQMLFSSVYGSYINYKKGKLEVNEGLWVGFGAIVGGAIGARFTDLLPKEYLEYIFLALLVFSLSQVIKSKPLVQGEEEGSFSKMTLFFLGLGIGTIAMMLGVGGSVMLTPVLVGFLHFPTKKAATAGLFFVVFSSISGFLYKLFAGTFETLHLELIPVFALAVAALLGVRLGLIIKDAVHDRHHRASLIVLYTIMLIMMAKDTLF